MALFSKSKKPIWMNDYFGIDNKTRRAEQKAIKYVKEKVNDDATLRTIILESPNQSIRLAAVEKLKNPNTISASDWFSVRDIVVEHKLLDRITDKHTLYQIVCREPKKNGCTYDAENDMRAAALKKIDDEKIAVEFLCDSGYTVEVEAARQITSPKPFLAALKSGVEPKKLDDIIIQRLDLFTPEALAELEPYSASFKSYNREKICEKAGHIKNEKCKCARCGKSLVHTWDAKNVCSVCGARKYTLREDYGKTEGGKFYKYGWVENEYIVYPDGTQEKHQIDSEITDRGTYNWLYQD